MAVCASCGYEASEKFNFCPECGSSASLSVENHGSAREEYAGKVIKCPNCGDPLDSLQTQCEVCGYEIRDAKATESIRDFTQKIASLDYERSIQIDALEEAPSAINSLVGRKARAIREFAIPNNKEDVLDFMVLAGSNIDPFYLCEDLPKDNPNRIMAEAWKAKFDQAYNKATVLFEADSRFERIEAINSKIRHEIKAVNARTKVQKIGRFISEYVGIFGGLLLLLIGLIIDLVWYNYQIVEFAGMAVLCVSAYVIGKEATSLSEMRYAVLGGVISIVLGCVASMLHADGSAMELTGILVFVIIWVQFKKGREQNPANVS